MAEIDRLQRAASALGQAMLVLSSVIFCVVLVVNQPFVHWLGVPNSPYAGDLLTGLLLLAMIARHANFAVVFTLFSLGGERRISLTTLADGAITVVGTVLLVRRFGLIGAPIASLIGATIVSLPANFRGLAARAGIPVIHWLRPLWSWAWRFVVLASGAALVTRVNIAPTFIALAITSTLVAGIVALVMLPVLIRPPLGQYLVPRLSRFIPGILRDNRA